jgi:putative ABC transport system substrate-binding protein
MASNKARAHVSHDPSPRSQRHDAPLGLLHYICLTRCVARQARANSRRKSRGSCFLTLELGTLQTRSPRFDGFFQALRDLGYVDGQSIAIDYLSADDDNERFPALAVECLRRKADIIYASTTPAAQAAKNATRTVPIVVSSADAVGTGLVTSLAQPGGNVTGVSGMFTELAGKRLQLLKQAVPGTSRVLVLTSLVDPIAPLQVKAMEEAAGSIAGCCIASPRHPERG